MIGAVLFERRKRGMALFGREAAARREAASLRQPRQRRHHPLDLVEPGPPWIGARRLFQVRQRAEQSPRIGVSGAREQIVGSRLFDLAPGVHDDDAVGDVGDHAEVVGDEHDRGPEALADVADEPTTALDVTIQAQILDLMRELQRKTGAAIVLITHDLGVVAEMAERVVVMYAGRKVEEAPVAELFAQPLHPYTRGLLDSIPKLGAESREGEGGQRKRLAEIAGTVPSLSEPIVGCAFAPRCSYATSRCHEHSPPLEEKSSGHFAACWESERLATGADVSTKPPRAVGMAAVGSPALLPARGAR